MRKKIAEKSKKYILIACAISISLCLISCGAFMPINNANNVSVEKEIASPGDEELKANDTAIVINIDQTLQNIIFQTITSDERYEVKFDGTTEFYDKYEQALSAAQIRQGDIAEVIVSVHSRKLDRFQLSAGYFEKTRVDSEFQLMKAV